MRRGVVALYLLSVVVCIWLGYRSEYRHKPLIMTQKETIDQQAQQIAELQSELKSYKVSHDAMSSQIMTLEKENKNAKTLMSIYKDKIINGINKNNWLLRSNVDKLKEFRPLIDSLILFNLEEIHSNDGQSRKPEAPKQRQAGEKN